MWRHLPAAFLVLALGGACAMDDRAVDPADMPAAPGASTEPPPASSTPETEPSPSVTESVDDAVVGQVVRFTSERTHVDVTISDDGPAVRDFLELLPLELTVEEFSGREKIADLPRELEMAGTPGSDPDDGDLIYYAPCGEPRLLLRRLRHRLLRFNRRHRHLSGIRGAARPPRG